MKASKKSNKHQSTSSSTVAQRWWALGRNLALMCSTAVLVMLLSGWYRNRNVETPRPTDGNRPETAALQLGTQRQPEANAAAGVSTTAIATKNLHFEPTILADDRPVEAAPPGMRWIPGGEFSMGCNDPRSRADGGPDGMVDARPIHRVAVSGFWMDETEVTNAQFREFVEATGYITVAERTPRLEDFPGAPPENLVAGSIIFAPPAEPVSLTNHYSWWDYVVGANWRHPLGPDSHLDGQENYPVVHVVYEDAVAYATWAGKRLPTEAEWEFASRGGQPGQWYSWGDQLQFDGKWMSNTFQGTFPYQDLGSDGFIGIAPTKQYPANAFGLYDMSGNVWEWCSDWYRPDYYGQLTALGAVAVQPQGPSESFDPAEPEEKKRVHRGGSFLCTDQYCTRYLLGTRGKGEVSSGSNHVGFRCVKSPSN